VVEKAVMPRQATVLPSREPEEYNFSSSAEQDATYFVTAWFAVTESASLGIFPLLPALETSATDPAYFSRFFERGFIHFKDEQRHANLWCKALHDFTKRYPDSVRRVKLPRTYMRIMLRSIGKPHDVAGFVTDCLAFEVVMQALYDVLTPRLDYPPVRRILEIISRDEEAHTDFGRHHFANLLQPFSAMRRARLAFRFWRNLLGVCITISPMLKAVGKHHPFAPGEFYARLSHYARESEIAGSRTLAPKILAKLK
jgi:hypothetical protein